MMTWTPARRGWRRRPATIALTLAAAAIPLAGCGDDGGGGGGGATSASADGKDLGLVQLIQPGVHPYIDAGNEGARRAAEELGIELDITQSDFTPAKEIANIQNAITKGAKAIVLHSANSIGVEQAVKQAVAKDICMVALAVNVGDDEYVDEVYPGMKGFVGLDEYASGRDMGESLAKEMGGKGNVVIIQGVLPNVAAAGRERGARDVWEEEYPEITVLDSQQADFDAAKARAVMQGYIQKHGDKIDGVLAITGNMGVAAADVIATSNLAGEVAITSTGAPKAFVDRIRSGKASSSAVELPVDEAAKAVELAVDCLEGDKEPVFFDTNQLPAAAVLKDQGYVVNKDNVDAFTPQW